MPPVLVLASMDSGSQTRPTGEPVHSRVDGRAQDRCGDAVPGKLGSSYELALAFE